MAGREFWTMAECAAAWKVDRRAALRYLLKQDAAEKRGGRWFTDRSLLQHGFPRSWETLVRRLPD